MPIPISQWLAIVAAEDREAARAKRRHLPVQRPPKIRRLHSKAATGAPPPFAILAGQPWPQRRPRRRRSPPATVDPEPLPDATAGLG
jgi:hypothetical protein